MEALPLRNCGIIRVCQPLRNSALCCWQEVIPDGSEYPEWAVTLWFRTRLRPTQELRHLQLCSNPQLVSFSSRFHRSATPRQPRSWATTSATISSHGWFLLTRSRPRPWWTSSGPWAGLTSPPSPRRAAMARREWRPSHSSPKKQVRRINNKILFNLATFFSFFCVI